MTAADKPIQEQVNRALNVFRDAFRDFAVQRLRAVRGRKTQDLILASLRGRAYDVALDKSRYGADPRDMFDVGGFFYIVRDNWHDAFGDAFRGDRSVLNALSQIGGIRNDASHSAYGRDVERDFAMSRVSDMADILGRVNKADAQAEVRAIWDALDKMRVSEQPPAPAPPSAVPSEKPGPAKTRGRGGRPPLKAWREVIRPREDVAAGNVAQSQFAASLSDVYSGRAEYDYADPFAFFRRTYVTGGIETLLVNALKRLSGNGGEPVIQTKTVFGGGKTHSLIALYHLVNSGDALINPRAGADAEDRRISGEIREIMRKAGTDPEDGVSGRVAVIDCNEITATTSEKTPDGDPLNTLWGAIAYQLGGQAAYDIIGDAARGWTSPGTAELRALFAHVGPCVILIDELVAYARNIPTDNMRGIFQTFVHYLTDAARQSDRVALVMTVPESDMEAGSAAGKEALAMIDALASLEHTAARVEAVWHPLEVSETFEVIRRRLFADEIDEAERDRTCGAFADMYRQRRADYPPEASESQYRDRLKRCYPIHPEFFDRVFDDWSSDPRFQRTRGVLRVMAAAISRLYARGDSSPLIMPGDAPLYDVAVNQQFARLLGDNWGPVFQEIDSDGGKLEEIDRQVRTFAEIGASRRLARAIFFGSKPGAVTGATRDRLNLAVVRPGEGAATYGDALGRMTGSLYYLYEQDGRRYFHNEENLNRLAADRARELTEEQVHDKIRDLLKIAVPSARRRAVALCPADSAAVADDARARLVVLPPDKTIPSRESERAGDANAETFALDILQNRGRDAPRIRKNSLIFLAARRDEMRDLDRKTREFLAWESIVSPAIRTVNLAGERLNQASRAKSAAKDDMDAALQSAYVHILAPEQPDGAVAKFHLARHRTSPTNSGEIIAAAFDTLIAEELLLAEITARSLLNGVDGKIWRAADVHISISALWDGLANYVHAPFRLANQEVLLAAITQGVQDSAFGYAPRPEDAGGELYPDLAMGELTPISETGVIVRKEMAAMVLDERKEKTRQAQATQSEGGIHGGTARTYTPEGDPKDKGGEDALARPPMPTSIEVRKTLSAGGYITDLAMISGEIVRNLFQAGEGVEVSIEITAKKPSGFSDSTTRPVKENSDHIGLEYGESGKA